LCGWCSATKRVTRYAISSSSLDEKWWTLQSSLIWFFLSMSSGLLMRSFPQEAKCSTGTLTFFSSTECCINNNRCFPAWLNPSLLIWGNFVERADEIWVVSTIIPVPFLLATLLRILLIILVVRPGFPSFFKFFSFDINVCFFGYYSFLFFVALLVMKRQQKSIQRAKKTPLDAFLEKYMITKLYLFFLFFQRVSTIWIVSYRSFSKQKRSQQHYRPDREYNHSDRKTNIWWSKYLRNGFLL